MVKFIRLNQAIEDTEFRKLKTETISPIEDHVQKENTEEDYSEEEWWNNGFLLEEHVQKDNTEEDDDSEEEWWNSAFMQEEHVLIQKYNAKKKTKEAEEAKARVYDSEDGCETRRGCVFETDTKRIRCFAIASLESYNKQTGAMYKLKRVVEARAYMCSGLCYEITFIAEECSSDNEPDEPALEYLEWDDEGDEKVFYSSDDDKSSDKLFESTVFWELSGMIEVDSCVIKTKDDVNFKV